MRHVITEIRVFPVKPARTAAAGPISLQMIPGTGSLSSSTTADGLKEKILLQARLQWTDVMEDVIRSEYSLVEVKYEDEESSAILSTSFGSADIPAIFQVENAATRTIKCEYTRAI